MKFFPFIFVLPDLIVPNIEISNKNGLHLNMKIQLTPKAIVGFIFRVIFGLASFSTNIKFLADVLTNTLEVLHREIKDFFFLFLSFPFLLVVVMREGFVHRGRNLTRAVRPALLLLRFWDFLNY